MSLSLDDLLNALQKPTTEEKNRKWDNTRSTWEAIGNKDAAALGVDENELESLIEEFVAENEYSNI